MGIFPRIILSLLTSLFSLTAFAAAGHIHIQDPWMRAAPPTVNVLAAYMTIVNTGEKARKLMRISSPSFARIEIHQSVMKDDIAHMEHRTELAIPAHSTVALQPGGLHLMLMEANKTYHAGDFLTLSMTFLDGEEIPVVVVVRSGQKVEKQGTDRLHIH